MMNHCRFDSLVVVVRRPDPSAETYQFFNFGCAATRPLLTPIFFRPSRVVVVSPIRLGIPSDSEERGEFLRASEATETDR